MKSTMRSVARGAVSLMLGVSLAAACAGAAETDEADPATLLEETATTEEVDLGALEENLTSVNMVDCSICATARSCCHAVSSRTSFCNNFDADRCETLDPGRQKTTKRNCLVMLRTTISAWRSSGRTAPHECRIPGE